MEALYHLGLVKQGEPAAASGEGPGVGPGGRDLGALKQASERAPSLARDWGDRRSELGIGGVRDRGGECIVPVRGRSGSPEEAAEPVEP